MQYLWSHSSIGEGCANSSKAIFYIIFWVIYSASFHKGFEAAQQKYNSEAVK